MFQEKLGKLIRECQTYLGYTAAKDDRSGTVPTRTPRHAELQSEHYHKHAQFLQA